MHYNISQEGEMADSDLVTVYSSMGMLRAQVIRGKLEASGVPVYLKYESVGQVFGLTVDGLGLVEVKVPEIFVDQALDLIREDAEDDPESGDAEESEAG
jgi:hypothetical protein